MLSGSKPPGQSHMLPEGSLPCIWMTAGLIAYKLCDLEYDCESCPLDAALQGRRSGRSADVVPEMMELGAWGFPSDRRYHPSHGWVKETESGCVRCGVDIFAGRLLAHASSVVLPPAGSWVMAGSPACWVMDDAFLIPLNAPVTGTVERVNPAVQASPSLMATSPYAEGWLLDIRRDPPRDDPGGLLEADQMRARTENHITELREEGLSDLVHDEVVGPTLADGGEPMGDLRRILGPERYHRLIERFLH